MPERTSSMKTKPSSPSRPKVGKLLAFAALGAYFAVLFVGGLINGGKTTVLDPEFIIYFHPLTYTVAWLVVAGILVAYGFVSGPVVYGFTWIAALCFSLGTAMAGGSYPLTFAMCGLMAVMTYVCGRALRDEHPAKTASRKMLCSPLGGKIAVGLMAAVAGGITLSLLLSSYLAYTTSPSVSTGVYVQMMESLRSGFSFDTTLEFGSETSHLAAHISPIFLVYLPFYALIPSPVTLLVLQTLAVYSAVIPLWLICRRKGLSPALSATLCGLLCFFPALWGGTSGSFHEYALLLPLLLWLILALETHKKLAVWITAALILCIRETCAIHLFTLGLYWLLTNRKSTETDGVSRRDDRIRALILMGVSALYFITAMILLTYVGKGTLITRFDNVTGIYATDFGTLIRALIFNPAIALYEMLTEAKLHYVLCMLLPMGLLPLLSKQKRGLVFLLPFLLLNLLSDFPYHFRLDGPYSFGITAFGFYLAVIALTRLSETANKAGLARRLITLAACFTLLIGGFRLADHGLFVEYALDGRAEITAMDSLLDAVEDDASVSASGRLIANLAARDEIYSLAGRISTDYVVLDLRDEWALPSEKDYNVKYYEERGYTVVKAIDGVGAVLKKGS